MVPLLALALAVSSAAPVLTLEEALAEAERRNPQLATARARLEQARTLPQQTRAGYLPQLAARGTYTYNSVEARFPLVNRYAIRDVGTPTSPPGGLPGTPTPYELVPADVSEVVLIPRNQWSGVLELRQALVSPALWPALSSARLSAQVSALDTEVVRRDLLFNVAQAYYAVAGLGQAVQASEALLELHRAREQDTQARHEAGTVTRLALLRTQLDRAQAEQDLVQARNALHAARLTLATLLAREPDFELAAPPPPELPPEEADLVRLALETRPELRAAREGVELALSRRREVLFSYAPSLVLHAQAQLTNATGFIGQNVYGFATVGLDWTLWDGGLREARLREASARLAEAEARRSQVEWQVREEVARVRLDLADARANLNKAQESLQLARETLRLAELSFRAGVATYLEVTDASASLTRTSVEEVRQRLQVELAALRLLRAVGRFALRPDTSTPASTSPPPG